MIDKLETLVLKGEDIQAIIEDVGADAIMDELIEKSYEKFVNFNPSDSIMPIRSGFNYSQPQEGLVEWMPIRNVKEEEVLVKVVAYHPKNPLTYKLPTIISTISKYSTANGHLKTIIDGVLPTSLRTGAASAIASKLFAKPQSENLGLIGCGAQSITQLHAISRVFEIKKVFYYDIDSATQQTFKERVEMLNLSIEFVSSNINEIVAESDILSTATSIGIGDGPLFNSLESKEWLHINAIGSDFEGKFELPLSLLKRSYVCPDWLPQAKIEGECQQLEEGQVGENLFQCLKVANTLQHLKTERTVFDSTGLPLQDLVATDLFLHYAKKMGLGQKINIENSTVDEKNPYSFLRKLKPH